MIDRDKQKSIEMARRFVDLGFSLVATHGTADRLEKAGLPVERVYKVKEGRPNVVDLIKGERVHLIVNTPHGRTRGLTRKPYAAPPLPIACPPSPRWLPPGPLLKALPPCSAMK